MKYSLTSSVSHTDNIINVINMHIGLPHVIVEVGVFRGDTAFQLQKTFDKSALYLVDPWCTYDKYDGMIHGAGPPYTTTVAHDFVVKRFRGLSNVHILKMMSSDAVSLVPNNVDIVFIDANHEYEFVKQDIVSWLPKIRCGGIICGHDYSYYDGVRHAVDETLPKHFLYGTSINQIWVYKL